MNRSRRTRLRLTGADRVLWGWLSRVWRGWRPTLVLVTPATVLAWHRRGFRYGDHALSVIKADRNFNRRVAYEASGRHR